MVTDCQGMAMKTVLCITAMSMVQWRQSVKHLSVLLNMVTFEYYSLRALMHQMQLTPEYYYSLVYY